MSVFDIERQALDLLDDIAESGGDLDGFDERIADIIGVGDEAATRCWHVFHRLKAEQAHRKATAAHYAALSKSAAQGAERVRGLLLRLMLAREAIGEEPKVRGYCHTQTRESVVYADDFDVGNLPAGFVITKTTVQPDKWLIRSTLEAGETVPGATLTTTRGVVITRRK